MDVARTVLNFTGGLTDRLMTRIPGFMLSSSTLPREAYLERLAFYAEWRSDVPFFPIPDSPPVAERIEERPHPSGKRLLYRYPSRFSGHNPAMRDELSRSTNNQSAYLHVWRHDDGTARPLVLCVHGFGMEGPRRAERMFKVGRLFERGVDVALYHLPHHWRRADGRRKSEFLRPENVPFTIEEWARNVHDLHSAVLLLRSLGHQRVGLIGASLGGLTGALYATTPAPLEFVFLVVPAVDLTSFLLPRPGRMEFVPDAMLMDATRAALRRITPLSYVPSIDAERIAVLAHEGDRICPVRHTRDLVHRWKIPNYTEVVGGHWVYLDHKVRGRTWYGWLQRSGFLGQEGSPGVLSSPD
jgi:pimeloyl-ACP methyl ester carboxylesterase